MRVEVRGGIVATPMFLPVCVVCAQGCCPAAATLGRLARAVESKLYGFEVPWVVPGDAEDVSRLL